MAKIIFCLVAENIITDSSNNLISIMNLVEKIESPSLPVVRPLLYFFIYWKKEGPINATEKFSFRIRIGSPNGSYLDNPHKEIAAEIPAEKDRLRFISKMEDIPLQEEGDLEFVVEQKSDSGEWTKTGGFPVTIALTSK